MWQQLDWLAGRGPAEGGMDPRSSPSRGATATARDRVPALQGFWQQWAWHGWGVIPGSLELAVRVKRAAEDLSFGLKHVKETSVPN